MRICLLVQAAAAVAATAVLPPSRRASAARAAALMAPPLLGSATEPAAPAAMAGAALDEHGVACAVHRPSTDASAKARTELAQQQERAAPYEFPAAYVAKALNCSVDYRHAAQNTAGVIAVTPGKDQGAHGTCGTFGRTAAAEGQYAIRSGHALRNFSEEELVDCQWQQRGLPIPSGVTAGDPLVWMDDKGFLSTEDYPYHTAGPECVVYNYTYNNTCFPCEWKASEVIPGSRGNWTGIASAVGEDQMAAFVHHNGPIWIGINSHVFGLRDNATNQVLACNGTVDGGGGSPENCFITPKMCADGRISKQIDHAVTVVGYGVDAEHGAYWQIKNSWSQKFGNAGFIKVARGIGCAGVASGNTNTYGDMGDYRCPHKCDLATRSGRTVRQIASLKELYALQSESLQHVVLRPGNYSIGVSSDIPWPNTSCPRHGLKHAALFNFSGSDNVYDLSGATIEFDVKVLKQYPCLHGPHGIGSVLGGSRNVWLGLRWNDVAPLDGSLDYGGFYPGSGSSFIVQGRGHVFDGLSISLRGSGTYGFGALYGKGKNNDLPGVLKSKRALLTIIGAADLVIRNAVLDNSAFGHVVDIHDKAAGDNELPHTNNLTFVNVTVIGEVRTTEDMLQHGVGGVDRHGVPFRVTYNGTTYAGSDGAGIEGAKGQAAFAPVFNRNMDRTDHCVGPIAKGKAFALTEDGFRNYDNVGLVTLINCTAIQTRCGICLMSAPPVDPSLRSGTSVDGLTVRSVAPHGWAACDVGESNASHPELGESFQPSSNSRLTRCAGDATFVPLLTIQATHISEPPTNVSADVELLLPEAGRDYARTYDSLAIVDGNSHFVRLWGRAEAAASALAAGLKVYVGGVSIGGADVDPQGRGARTHDVVLCNLLPVPVLLSNQTSNVRVWSVGNVTDRGQGNKVVRLANSQQAPTVCNALKPNVHNRG